MCLEFPKLGFRVLGSVLIQESDLVVPGLQGAGGISF